MLEGQIQSLTPGVLVDLFEIDVSTIDPAATEPFRFVPMTDRLNTQVTFRTETYQPMPITVSGFKKTARGALPRPTMEVSNINSTITALLLQYDDFRGAILKRIRTFEEYLDDGDDADPLAVVAEDVWRVERKVAENIATVQFELASALDWHGQKLPARVVYHNACPFIYEGQVLGIGNGECPYANGGNGTQSNMYTELDVSTADPDLDKCGKRVWSCELRFGEGNDLYSGAFPGAQRVLKT